MFRSLAILLACIPPALAADKPNIILILADDHRYDCVGVAGHPWIETPHLDRMAEEGVYFPKAIVTTSLCSPSRASILTGLYTHNHQVSDNYNPVDPDLLFFPQLLQKEGYETAFIGKWHMGDVDDPQRGFDHWAAFKGQGTYWPDGRGTLREVPQTSYDGFNINGERVPQKGYITDELTDYATDWLTNRQTEKPYFLYVSHKGVHSDFVPADRHLGRYTDKPFPEPPTMADTEENYGTRPRWLKDQRNSRHGMEFGYNLDNFDVKAYYRRYCEAVLALDDSVGGILKWLEENDELENTLVVYMGDNGFQFGDHGLIDKRVAYGSSIRVPLLALCPSLFSPGTVVERTVANIDIAPTLLEAAGVAAPENMDGVSFLPLAKGEEIPFREEVLYEYFWEPNYPQTPTMHALVTDDYKYIRYHGVWDTDELFDLQKDPYETTNLAGDPAQESRVIEMNARLHQLLEETHGTNMPLKPDRGNRFPWRHPERSTPGEFPERWFQKNEPPFKPFP
ncbi:MAG: sulfatase [Verrucomicrobiota bacterium]